MHLSVVVLSVLREHDKRVLDRHLTHRHSSIDRPTDRWRPAGESEANVRKLFEDAEADQKANGDASELHVIIFDEIDAICKQRGSVSSGSGSLTLVRVPLIPNARVGAGTIKGLGASCDLC